MITKDLEAKLASAIATAVGSASVQVISAWGTATQGALRNVESDAYAAVVAVALGTPSMPTFTASEVTFSGAVSVSVRAEMDASGATLVAVADALLTLFRTWQSQTYQQTFMALDLPGLSVDEVGVGASAPPAYDRPNAVITLDIPITLSGTYRDASPTSTTAT